MCNFVVLDMGSITLDVLGGRHAAVVGRASIDSLAALTPNKPINGYGKMHFLLKDDFSCFSTF